MTISTEHPLALFELDSTVVTKGRQASSSVRGGLRAQPASCKVCETLGLFPWPNLPRDQGSLHSFAHLFILSFP